ncbi:MAG: lipocalin-like domain-containing protein [Acidobacteriota bacterium]
MLRWVAGVFVLAAALSAPWLALSAGAEQPTPVRERLVGTWRLVTYQIIGEDGKPARPGAYDVGRITYDRSGQMSAQLMHSSQKADKPPATDEERVAAYRRYLGYFGPFSVDEARGIVVHHVAGSSNPSFVGSDLVRHYTFSSDGNQLTLAVKNGERVTQTLLWERIR